MNIGLLNIRITIQKSVLSTDAIGNQMSTWQDYFSCAATAGGESGSEPFRAGQTVPVYTNTPPHLRVPSRKMTLDAMENDFTYRIAQKMTRLLLDEGLISLVEYDKLVEVNSDIFYPFLHGIMR